MRTEEETRAALLLLWSGIRAAARVSARAQLLPREQSSGAKPWGVGGVGVCVRVLANTHKLSICFPCFAAKSLQMCSQGPRPETTTTPTPPNPQADAFTITPSFKM